jgi:hypothetical protein
LREREENKNKKEDALKSAAADIVTIYKHEYALFSKQFKFNKQELDIM